MSERWEIVDARKRLDLAREEYERIRQLPQDIGATIRWVHNGVVWRRIGDDGWKPIPDFNKDGAWGTSESSGERFCSAHVAGFKWEAVDA